MKKYHKTLYINIAIFIVVLLLSFVIGYIVIINFSVATSAAEEEDATPPKIFNVQLENISATSAQGWVIPQ